MMLIFKLLNFKALRWCVFALLAFSGVAQGATQYVMVHGYSQSHKAYDECHGQSECNIYFEFGQLSGNVVHVGWKANQEDWRYNPVIRTTWIFDQYCRGSKDCTVICHSTGCPIVGKALSVYGKNNRWSKIKRVIALGSAEGGSELGAYWDNARFISPSSVRAAYDHNVTRNVRFYSVQGYDGNIASWKLPGQDDGVVAYHSACGYSSVVSATKCKGAKKGPFWKRKTVKNWANHYYTSFCGNKGCNVNHSGLKAVKYQNLADLSINP